MAMSEEMRQGLICMQEAVDEEMERKAELGCKAVIGDKNGKLRAVSGASTRAQ